ncbi:unnamed protein product [Moneuplotes crassus]|uniref:Uncharacterized protein n=1 Tax=Euplotes crassus TaxID=5936 RepID=A0AAD1UF54_EUPCR|nr:unnamed protein product [Moneuplotes crassus]
MEESIPFVSIILGLREEDRDNCVFYMIFVSLLLMLSLITVILTCWRTTKFILLFKSKKLLTTIFLLLLTLSAIARVSYFSTEIYWRHDQCSVFTSRCKEASVYWLSGTLFTTAMIVYLFNWIYQTLRMKKFITGVRQKQMKHHICFVSLLAIDLLAYAIFVTGVCVFRPSESIVSRLFLLFYGITFLLIALVFIFIGRKLYKEYKRFFEDKAKKIRFKVILSITIISVAFTVKGSVSFAYSWGNILYRYRAEWLKTNSFWYPFLIFLYFTITEIFPTIFLCMGVRSIAHQLHKKRHEDMDYSLSITSTTSGTLEESFKTASDISVIRDTTINDP